MSLDKTIRNVQTALGVAADGQAGPQTWTAIHAQVAGKKPAAGAGLDTIIRAVQKKLGVAVDGNPGPQTWGGDSRSCHRQESSCHAEAFECGR